MRYVLVSVRRWPLKSQFLFKPSKMAVYNKAKAHFILLRTMLIYKCHDTTTVYTSLIQVLLPPTWIIRSVRRHFLCSCLNKEMIKKKNQEICNKRRGKILSCCCSPMLRKILWAYLLVILWANIWRTIFYFWTLYTFT